MSSPFVGCRLDIVPVIVPYKLPVLPRKIDPALLNVLAGNPNTHTITVTVTDSAGARATVTATVTTGIAPHPLSHGVPHIVITDDLHPILKTKTGWW